MLLNIFCAVYTKILSPYFSSKTNGYINRVNLPRVRSILARKYERTMADEYLDWLLDFEVTPVAVDALWADAAKYIIEYNPALGDSFALATAENIDGIFLIRADDDYNDITEGSIQRFREKPAK